MHILLCESHYRSRPWLHALRSIDAVNQLSIIYVNRGECRFFSKDHFKAELKLEDFSNFKRRSVLASETISNLNTYEYKYAIEYRRIIHGDRRLRVLPESVTLNYLFDVTSRAEAIFKRTPPRLVIMEATWAHELIVCQLAKKQGIPVYCPGPVRFVRNRIFFFKNDARENFFERASGQTSATPSIEFFKEPPEDFETLSKRNAFSISKLKPLFRLLRDFLFKYRNYFIQPSLFEYCWNKSFAIIRFYLLKGLEKSLCSLPKENERYCLIGLHVQPEASIDVVGRRFSNQKRFVEDIRRALPVGCTVFVREHPHAVGSRPIWHYLYFRFVLHAGIAPFFEKKDDILRGASLVLTVAGTLSLEAAAQGVRSGTAQKMFFSDVLEIKELPTDPIQLREMIIDVLARDAQNHHWRDRSKRLEALVRQHSFPGKTSAPNRDDYALSEENLSNLSIAFNELISAHLD